MTDQAAIVVDTNVLLNLATPVVDSRPRAPTGGDPLLTVLSVYDVHVPRAVVGEITEAASGDDLLATAADAVLAGTDRLTTHEVDAQLPEPIEYGLDTGESHAIWLANEMDAEMLVTDEFNTTNYLLVSLALADRNVLFTTPHVLCKLGEREIISSEYVDAALSYYVETKQWDSHYVDRLRRLYLDD